VVDFAGVRTTLAESGFAARTRWNSKASRARIWTRRAVQERVAQSLRHLKAHGF
jgi:cell division GTPase FtsZ